MRPACILVLVVACNAPAPVSPSGRSREAAVDGGAAPVDAGAAPGDPALVASGSPQDAGPVQAAEQSLDRWISPDGRPTLRALAAISATLAAAPEALRKRIPPESYAGLIVLDAGTNGQIRIPIVPRCRRYECKQRIVCRDIPLDEACPISIPGPAFPSMLNVVETAKSWKKDPRACCFDEKYECRDIPREHQCADM